jgi:hypothetical protein
MSVLNKDTHKKVKSLAKNTCANFIGGGCVFGGACDYFTKYGDNISCDFFEQSVLPTDKSLEQAYKEQQGINYVEKSVGSYERTCKGCGKVFKTDSKNTLTCSDDCRAALRKETKRKHYLGQS